MRPTRGILVRVNHNIANHARLLRPSLDGAPRRVEEQIFEIARKVGAGSNVAPGKDGQVMDRKELHEKFDLWRGLHSLKAIAAASATNTNKLEDSVHVLETRISGVDFEMEGERVIRGPHAGRPARGIGTEG